MELREFLSERKSRILERWFEEIILSYPLESRQYLRSHRDRFENPLGHTILEGIKGVLNYLLGEKGYEEILPSLENLVKIRAVQDISPSKAVDFVFLLKKILREECGDKMMEEFLSLSFHIDNLVLRVFDIYAQCRERLYDTKFKELRNMTYILLEKANRVQPGFEIKQT